MHSVSGSFLANKSIFVILSGEAECHGRGNPGLAVTDIPAHGLSLKEPVWN
jgi:hypothetical protein